jgi:hypothetical protein
VFFSVNVYKLRLLWGQIIARIQVLMRLIHLDKIFLHCLYLLVFLSVGVKTSIIIMTSTFRVKNIVRLLLRVVFGCRIREPKIISALSISWCSITWATSFGESIHLWNRKYTSSLRVRLHNWGISFTMKALASEKTSILGLKHRITPASSWFQVTFSLRGPRTYWVRVIVIS